MYKIYRLERKQLLDCKGLGLYKTEEDAWQFLREWCSRNETRGIIRIDNIDDDNKKVTVRRKVWGCPKATYGISRTNKRRTF